MGYEIAKLAAPFFSAMCTPLKDLFLYLKNEAEYVEDLEDNLTKLTIEMTIINSRKKHTDRILEMSVSKEPTVEYRILLKQIEVFHKKYTKFMTKYQKACNNLQSPMSEPNVSVASGVIEELQDGEPNVSVASGVIEELQNRKPTILTRKFCTLAKLSRDISKLLDFITRVNDRLKLENMAIQKKLDAIQVKEVDDGIPVLNKYVNEVLKHLPEKDRIGIVGPIGVGKTTVMKKLNNQLEDVSSHPDNLRIEIVIWVTYPTKQMTKDQVIETIQDEIMTRLKINHEKGNSIDQNAFIISEALRHKKYILLMDQVSTPIELHMVGIQKEHEFGKVVVASRINRVINKMTDLKVEIEKLSDGDALDLFQKILGTILDPRIKDTADGIIKSCGGLPLVITLVATYLKHKTDESSWCDVKRMLQSNTSVNLLGLAGICNAYKMVYDELPQDYLKSCSLYGALFPIEHEICKDYLIECWVAEHFIDIHGIQKLRANRDHGVTVLNELIDRYLLERCSEKYVKVPRYFRRVALEENFPLEENGKIWAPSKNEVPNEEVWMTATRMSLIQCKSELPESPKSSNISTLLLQQNPKLVTLADLFFSHMKNLRVLDLHRTGIKWLPKSISELFNLRNLYLNDCSNLETLPSEVKNLKNLELLDICRTSIPWLPQEIKSMDSLRCLRASFVQKEGCSLQRNEVEVMCSPYNIISHLKQLEELRIEADVCSQSWITVADQIALELSGLEKLTTLCFNFPSVNSLQKFVSSSKSWNNKRTDWGNNTFRSFKIFIGVHGDGHPDINGAFAERHLRFSTNEKISSVKEVLKQASAFELISHNNVDTLSEFDLKNLGSLKVCVVEKCNSLLNIVDASKTKEMSMNIVEESATSVLPSLVKLHLLDLKVLQCIWKGMVFPGSLSNLTVLTLCGCPELTEVLTPVLAKNFSNLKYLKVEKCSKIMNIIEAAQVNLPDILRKVEIIELVNLPQLQSICETATVNWILLKKIVVIECRNLKYLPFNQDNAKSLSLIQCEESWWNVLQLLEKVKQHFHPCCKFICLNKSSANGANPKGETSSNVNSPTYNGDRLLESLTTSSHQTIDMHHQTEMRKGKAGLGTSASPNIDDSAKNENFLPLKTRFCQHGSSDIPSLEMYSLADVGVQMLEEVVSSNHMPAVLQSSSIVPAAASN